MKNPDDEPYPDFVEPVTEFNPATTTALGHAPPPSHGDYAHPDNP
ncbi:hypothetical protein [Nocardia miyunensis]|nr:hypothetical protein [Nocardia miyunensis]